MPVTDPVQLDGLWLLRGTSLLLAVDQRGGPAAYVMDDDGDLQPAPDAEGRLSVAPNGVIVLDSAGWRQHRPSTVRGARTANSTDPHHGGRLGSVQPVRRPPDADLDPHPLTLPHQSQQRRSEITTRLS